MKKECKKSSDGKHCFHLKEILGANYKEHGKYEPSKPFPSEEDYREMPVPDSITICSICCHCGKIIHRENKCI